MRDDDAVEGEMRRLHRAHRDPFALDQDTAERLLSGWLDPDDAPPGYARVAELLARAASDQPAPEEKAGKAAALAAFAAVRTRSPHPPIPQRWSVLTKMFTVKAVVAALLGVLAVGGVAAATGNLPTPAQLVAGSHSGMGVGNAAHTPPSTTDHGKGQGQGAGRQGQGQGHDTASSNGQANGQGPTLPGPAANGLCQAWSDGQGAANGKKMDAVAFQALVKAAGGEGNVASFCAKVMSAATSTTSHGQGQGTGTGTGNGGANGNGNGSGNGNGNN